jgi:hypothetical protein
MTLQEIQYKAQGIIHKWRDDDSAPYIEFVEELAHMIVPEPSEDLEEAARKYQEGVPVDTIIYYCGTDEDVYFTNRIVDAFIDGAKWQKEQMMKEAVEADVNIYGDIVAGKNWAEFVVEMPTNNLGDKVRLIVIPNTDKK